MTGEDSQPVNPLTITSASLSSTSPDGVVILDTTAGEAGRDVHHHRHGHRPDRRHDGVAVVQRRGRRLRRADDVSRRSVISISSRTQTRSRRRHIENTSTTVQLSGQNTYPDTSVKVPLDLLAGLAARAHGTVTNFNASTGTFTYTPDPGYVGTDTFQYEVTANGPEFDGRRRRPATRRR